jgi:putative heme-binding domain-containing protein
MKIAPALALAFACLVPAVSLAQRAPDFSKPTTASARSRAARASSGGPQWVWAAEQSSQAVPPGVCYFRKSFDLKQPEEGKIAITCDDRYELYVNGRKLGSGADWKVLDQYDITPHLVSGRNVIAIRAENVTAGSAALMARVTVKRVGDTEVSHSTDRTWRTSLKEEANWEKTLFNDARWAAAHSFGEFGRTQPWGDQVRADNGATGGRFLAPKQFRVERIVEPESTGSLITMTFNEWGEIVGSREGEGLVLIRDEDKDGTPETVQTYCPEMKNCQGVLALNGSVFATGEGPEGLGLYRLTDDDQDGDIDTIKRLFAFKGAAGEHGPHGLVLGPDGLIYVMTGNFSGVETTVLPTSPLRTYYEGDLVMPRYEDAGGHDVGIKAPGGTVVRTDLDGSFVELFACGLRNCYDLAFNRQGELFTYDSDMEWDIGLPWYRPTRVNHLVPGSESGWRSGWAKWPDYYIDGLPAMMDIGRGSPTGVVFYNHYRYPQRYQNAMFACDWSQGRIIALTLQPAGGTYACGGEVFLQGRPLNVTDLAVGPDGWLYFCTGGRGTEGGVYRVLWQGKAPPQEETSGLLEALRQPQLESAWARERVATIKEEMGVEWEADLIKAAKNTTLPNADRVRALELMQLLGPSPTPALLLGLSKDASAEVRAKAVELMGLHADTAGNTQLAALLADPDATVRRRTCEALVRAGHQAPPEKLVALLGDPDRFVAWAARRALEAMPRDQWRAQVLAAKDTRVFLHGSVALLASAAERADADAVLARVGKLLTGFLTDEDFLDLLRVTQLALLRGAVPPEDVAALRSQLAEEYPSLEPRINRELVVLLVYLQDASVTDRFLDELRGKAPLVERIHLASYCRYCKTNWTPQQKLELLKFYEAARSAPGGYSYALYLANLTRDYVAEMNDEERKEVLANALKMPTAALGAVVRLPEHPSRETLDNLIKLDRRLKSLEGDAARQLGVGILAVLGRSHDPAGMAYMREVFEKEPERRPTAAMSLAQDPGGDNWSLLVRSLPVLDAVGSQEVVANLLKVDQVSDKPEDIRQAILCGLKMNGEGSDQAVALLEKWTGKKLSEPEAKWDAALAAWQQWFSEEYPDLPEPTLPAESAENRWTMQEIMTHLHGPAARPGDAARGQLVFDKALCVKCHRYGNRGEGIGPDLTTVSRRFHSKEILESVLFPSHVISDQYASKVLQTTDGQTLTGMVAQSGQDAVIVLQANGQKTLVPLAKIEDIAPAKKSAMPEGLFNPLSLEEIADLLAFLQSPPPETARKSDEK